MIKLRIIEEYAMNPKDLDRADSILSKAKIAKRSDGVYSYNRDRVNAVVDLNQRSGYIDVYSAKTWQTDRVYTLNNIDSLKKVEEFIKNFNEIVADVRSGARYESFRNRRLRRR